MANRMSKNMRKMLNSVQYNWDMWHFAFFSSTMDEFVKLDFYDLIGQTLNVCKCSLTMPLHQKHIWAHRIYSI